MKCKACNGAGYVTACVYESDEIGFVDKNYECAVCNGTGQIEQSNEEWFATLKTKEKAKAISQLSCYQGNIYEIEKWLKQPHREENEKNIQEQT